MKRRKLTKKERTEKNIGWVVGVILVAVIMVVAIFFIRQKFFGPTFDYKGYKVTEVNPKGTNAIIYVLRAPITIYGATRIHYLNLYNDPRELQYIEVENTTRKVLLDPKPKHVYVSFDPDMPKQAYVAQAYTQVIRILGPGGVFRLSITASVTKDIEGLENQNLTATCNDSKPDILVIELRYSNETRIWVDEQYWRCVRVEGTDENEIIRAADKVVLTLLGL